MNASRNRSRPPWTALVLALLPATAAGQIGPCVFDYASHRCVVQGGTNCAAGNGVGDCVFTESGCQCALPAYTLSVDASALVPDCGGNSSRVTVTVTPSASATGTLGDVRLSCGSPSPGVSCTLDQQTLTVTSSAPVSTHLFASIRGVEPGSYALTLTALDSAGTGPQNGAQVIQVRAVPCAELGCGCSPTGARSGDVDATPLALGALLAVAYGVRRATRRASRRR